MKKTKVVILGGGFAGLYAAMYLDKTLARRGEVELTVIARENYILFTPMLHEVAAGDLHPADIVSPVRRVLRHARFVEAEVQAIDLPARSVQCAGGVSRIPMKFEFDHLLIAMGSETNFFDLPGVSEWAMTMKSLSDATLLRNRALGLLEEASLYDDPAVRQQLLTFVVAGGGFSGVETAGALNDLAREASHAYPELKKEHVRTIVVHPGKFLLPELGEKLGMYAERKLCERKVEVLKGARVTGYDGSVVSLVDGTRIPASTLVWTAGVKPNPAIAPLPCRKEHNRLVVNEFLAIPDQPGLWAAGDCAAVPQFKTREIQPPTAQHGLREGVTAAKNIEAAILGRSLRPFTFTTLGQLASIGHRTGVAMMFGMKFSGFPAWMMWRGIYLMKLPGWSKKFRVIGGWLHDFLFPRDLEQMITLRDVEAMAQLAKRIHMLPGGRGKAA